MKKTNFNKDSIYIQPHDKCIQVMFTGKKKETTGMGTTFYWFQFKEIITPKNKNWCKGITFWSQAIGFKARQHG